jgi:hypothetical protein
MMATEAPNGQLRAAREDTVSMDQSGECLSRRELAERVNAYIWDRYLVRVELDANYLGKLERGTIRWPGSMCREALREILGVSDDSELGFRRPRRSLVKKVVPVNRKQFILNAALGFGVGALAPVMALLEGGEPTPVPARVGATDIEQVRSAAGVFESWGYTNGGGLVREAVLAQLRWSAGLLEATCPESLRPALFSAVGELAQISGWMAFDACAQDEARRVLSFALACAETAQDWDLRAGVLGCMTIQAICTGRPDEGLTLAEHALVRADRLHAAARAQLHSDRARALAKMGRGRDTLLAVGTADDEFAHSNPAELPQYWAYYDATFHTGVTGMALANLAMHGNHDPAPAIDRLTAAIASYPAENAGYRPQDRIRLASLMMVTGDPVEAAALGTAALESAAAAAVRSRRATDDLRQLDRHAARHSGVGEVAELRRRINQIILP